MTIWDFIAENPWLAFALLAMVIIAACNLDGLVQITDNSKSGYNVDSEVKQ